MTSKEKYLKYIDGEIKKGLVDIHFTTAREIDGKVRVGVTEEEIYDELCRMIEAPDLLDEEVLGKL